MNWSEPKELPIYGQRVTALKDSKNVVLGAYRDTSREDIDKRYVSIFEHNLKTDKIRVDHIDWEYPINQYHFGYSGFIKTGPKSYLLTYYIKQRSINPYVKLSFLEKL